MNFKKEFLILLSIFFVVFYILKIVIIFDYNTKLASDYDSKSLNNMITLLKINNEYEDIIYQPVAQRNFQTFYKCLTAQKFINENLDTVKLMDFIDHFDLATKVSKTASPEKDSINTQDAELPECVATLNYNVTVNLNKSANQYPNDIYPMVQLGGYYNPMNCRPLHKIAILIPIRDREANLRIFLYNIHPFLMLQKIEYKIFVFEQIDAKIPFNKGRLFNAGFREIEKAGGWDCIIFHDVDLLPTDHRIRYICPTLPTHMCPVVIEKLKFKFYSTIFGGVTAMSLWQYKVVNGYSNMYWAWGAEDNDMFKRLMLLNHAAERISWDGLSNHVYKKIKTSVHALHTRIIICINPNHDAVPSLTTTPRSKFFSKVKPTPSPGLFTSWLNKLK